uniref:Histone chaperone domain-containing protein n=1 Tax=Bionectria ochroleuca TaxID=29856 RepID=A0A8H7NF16_BIOOC
MSSENLQDAPTGEFQDDSYVSRPGTKGENIGVQADSDPVEDPIDAEVADTDEQLARDDAEAIDKDNILKGDRTRNAGKPSGTYAEPGDEEGLPSNDGTSSAN